MVKDRRLTLRNPNCSSLRLTDSSGWYFNLNLIGEQWERQLAVVQCQGERGEAEKIALLSRSHSERMVNK